jgi:g-D-glutamyl-meso-diaminopimelate peptidase
MDMFYSYRYMVKELRLLKRLYSSISTEVIGYSVLGQEIIAVKLGYGKREIHYNAAIHANEWITSALLMKFIHDCAYALEVVDGFHQCSDISTLFQRSTIWLVPMINPDGVDLVLEGIRKGHPFENELLEWNNHSSDFSGWKANIHGIDLNDQFPAHWEQERIRRNILQPGPMNYSGKAPLSEPEAIAIANLTLQHSFELVLALHTQGEEIYWNYRGFEPPESAHIANKFAEASGYRAVKINDSDAGYKDWFIQQFRRPGFTIEAGYGKNPLPIEQFENIYEKVSKILWLGIK